MTQYINDCIETLLSHFEIPYKTDITTDGDTFIVRVTPDENAHLLIGRDGEIIQSLQNILQAHVNTKRQEPHMYVYLDIADYREQKIKNILELAEFKAKKIISGESSEEFLPPMHPLYRRKVHLHFQESELFSSVSTDSVGEGNERQIRIIPNS